MLTGTAKMLNEIKIPNIRILHGYLTQPVPNIILCIICFTW